MRAMPPRDDNGRSNHATNHRMTAIEPSHTTRKITYRLHKT
ncbi:hypothetical protein RBEAN4_1265 [Rickettsia bellii str. RML An4]|uniref:Uncharacterized protein n=1 Tax=Rickettsia bellii str. RML An4 TaxID=1359193 RepID=A0A0F3QDB0_RICBE|nr:hypothetical protein RBEAN4_1265 [Rickettsia bellii str. RML An4]